MRFPSLSLRCDHEANVSQGLDLASYLSTWFRGSPLPDIKRENFKEFLAYAFCYRTMWGAGLRGFNV